MRFIYIDEAGRSAREPVTVVAGVIVNADTQYRLLADRLAALADEYVPAENRDGFVFHATDIFSGRGMFASDAYPVERRWALLERLAAIPREEGIPVSLAYVTKDSGFSDMTPAEEARWAHLIAFSFCVAAADRWVCNFGPREVSTVIAEDVTDMRGHLRRVPDFLRSQEARALPGLVDLLPLKSVVDTFHFVEKNRAPLLQIADVCAFVVRRYLSGQNHGKRYFDALSGDFIDTSSKFGSSFAGCSILNWRPA